MSGRRGQHFELGLPMYQHQPGYNVWNGNGQHLDYDRWQPRHPRNHHIWQQHAQPFPNSGQGPGQQHAQPFPNSGQGPGQQHAQPFPNSGQGPGQQQQHGHVETEEQQQRQQQQQELQQQELQQQQQQQQQQQVPASEEVEAREEAASAIFEDEEEWDPNHWSARLRCPICFEFYKDPYVMACGHSWCNQCVESIIRSQMEKMPNRPRDSISLACPSCRFTQTYGQYNSFAPRNLALEMTIESWNSSPEYKKYLTPKCDRCLQTDEDDIAGNQIRGNGDDGDHDISVDGLQTKEGDPKELFTSDGQTQTEAWPPPKQTCDVSAQVALPRPSSTVQTQTVYPHLKDNFTQTFFVRSRNKSSQATVKMKDTATQIRHRRDVDLCDQERNPQLTTESGISTQTDLNSRSDIGMDTNDEGLSSQTLSEEVRVRPHANQENPNRTLLKVIDTGQQGAQGGEEGSRIQDVVNDPSERRHDTNAPRENVPETSNIVETPLDILRTGHVTAEMSQDVSVAGGNRADDTSEMPSGTYTSVTSFDVQATMADVTETAIGLEHGAGNITATSSPRTTEYRATGTQHLDRPGTRPGTQHLDRPGPWQMCGTSRSRVSSKYFLGRDAPWLLHVSGHRDVVLMIVITVVILTDWKYITSAFVHDAPAFVYMKSDYPSYSLVTSQVVLFSSVLWPVSLLAVFYAVSYGIIREIRGLLVKH